MNYIKSLIDENRKSKSAAENATKEINYFIAFLQTSSKFIDVDQNGERKDWIATSDVIKRLKEIREILS